MTTNFPEVDAAIDELCSIYGASVTNLRTAIQNYVRDRSRPSPEARAQGCFAYPELRLEYEPAGTPPSLSRAYARLNQPGCYASSVGRPELFRDYLAEQLDHLVADFGVKLSVGRSASEIPYPYVLEEAGIELGSIAAPELARFFPSTELVHIGDEVVDGLWQARDEAPRPLALFDGPRTDFSLARLKHYTGTPPEDFQSFVLFTNYTRYVDEFIAFATAALRQPGSGYSRLSMPGGSYAVGQGTDVEPEIAVGPWRKYQMPAYHLISEGRRGITLVNIGVGPSNAKTICDHIAVLRPEVWLMIGHCGGLRESQSIGDYVLAHAYLRDDNVLDAALPPRFRCRR